MGLTMLCLQNHKAENGCKEIPLIPHMGTFNTSVSNCRHCQFYQIEGRRGGHCQQLSVSVQSGWKACALAIPAFSPAWAKTDEILLSKDVNPDVSKVPVSIELRPAYVSKATDDHVSVAAVLPV